MMELWRVGRQEGPGQTKDPQEAESQRVEWGPPPSISPSSKEGKGPLGHRTPSLTPTSQPA